MTLAAASSGNGASATYMAVTTTQWYTVGPQIYGSASIHGHVWGRWRDVVDHEQQ